MAQRSWHTVPRARAVLCAIAGVVVFGALGVGLEAVVRARLDEPPPSAGMRLYARPWVVRLGARLDLVALERYLERTHYRRTRQRRVEVGEYRSDRDRWIIGRRAFRGAEQLDPGGMVTIRVDPDGWVVGLEDGKGRSVSQVVLEPEPLRASSASGDDRVPVRLADLPPHLSEAVLAVEDHRFFHHAGLSVARIAAAAMANVRAGGIEQGASTISQQVAKNLFLSGRRTGMRKIREAAMALVLELRHSKEQILEAYLNELYLGQDGAFAIRGVGRAAQFYFGKDASQLELPESALLAGMIRGPNLYAPLRHPDAAKARRDRVLARMRDHGKLSDPEYRRAVRTDLGVRRTTGPTRAGRYFTDFVAVGLPPASGLTVFTTLDVGLQHAAESAVRAQLARLEREYPALRRSDAPLQAALVALDPWTGEVRAMVGGRDYGASQFNRATQARRQPGSAFKPVVALAALAPRSVTLASLLEDESLAVETPLGRWQPVNYDQQFRGAVTLRTALELSLNVPFARLGLQVGPERIVAAARKLGIESPLRAVPSLALGSSEVTPLELARAFGVLAAEGYRADPHAVLAAIDARGRLVQRAARSGEQVFTPSETYLVTSALEGAVERGTARGARAPGYQGPVAAKTGTSNDFRDAWFVGYTPNLVVAVWVGFDDGRSLGLPGARAALPIFARLLTATQKSSSAKAFEPPPDLEVVTIDRETGLQAGWACGGETEYFLPGTAPPAGERCSPIEEVPRWIASAGERAFSGVRSLLGNLLGRRPRP